jgi:hypothetical protein
MVAGPEVRGGGGLRSGAAGQRAPPRISVDTCVGLRPLEAILGAIERAAASAIGERQRVVVARRERGVRAFVARAAMTADVGVLIADVAEPDVADELLDRERDRLVGRRASGARGAIDAGRRQGGPALAARSGSRDEQSDDRDSCHDDSLGPP